MYFETYKLSMYTDWNAFTYTELESKISAYYRLKNCFILSKTSTLENGQTSHTKKPAPSRTQLKQYFFKHRRRLNNSKSPLEIKFKPIQKLKIS